MLENKLVKIGKYYIYVFDKCFSMEYINRIIKESEKRFLNLKNIICPSFQVWKKPMYVIEKIEGTPRGYAYIDLIKCQIPSQYDNEMPMMHEETHLITYQMIGKMSYAWSEGFAEYYVCLMKGEIDYMEGDGADFARLNSRERVDDIIYALTHEDTEFFNMLRRSNVFYSMSLASFIHFVKKQLGDEIFLNLQKMVVENDYSELDLFLRKTIFSWFDWLDGCKNVHEDNCYEI